MKHSDTHLVAGFLILSFHEFAEYLDACGIDPTEADVIIQDMIVESDGAVNIGTKTVKKTQKKEDVDAIEHQ